MDQATLDSIAGDLEEERRRRARVSAVGARVWFWRAWIGIAMAAARSRLADLVSDVRRSGGAGPRHEWRQAVRSLRRAPWYAASGIGVIALSLVLTNTVFAVVDGVMFRPLPFARPDRLVTLQGGFRALPDNRGVIAVSWPDLLAWKAAVPEIEFAATGLGGTTPVAEAETLRSVPIDAEFLRLLGVQPLVGGFVPEDFAGSVQAPIAPGLITYATWQGRFAGDPAVVGQIHTDASGRGIRIAGILPASFVFPTGIAAFAPDVLTPLVLGRWATDPASRDVVVFARLAGGMSDGWLGTRLSDVQRLLAHSFPVVATNPRLSPEARIMRGPFDLVNATRLDMALTTQTRPVASAVFWTAVGLLLLSCLNLVGLSASRFVDRRPELGLRRALGGSTFAILRLVTVEHVLVVLIGGTMGLALTPIAIAGVVRVLPRGVVLLKAVGFDLRVLVFSGLALVLTLAVVTFGAALALPRRLASQVRATESARGRGHAVIVAAQVALALVMTVSGALLGASLIRVWTAPKGWRLDDAVRLRVGAPRALDVVKLQALLDHLRQQPGVASVGAASLPLFERTFYVSPFEEPEGGLKTDVDTAPVAVTSEFFNAAGLEIVAGRVPSREEFVDGASVAVVSQTVADFYWPGRSALGQTLRRSTDGRVFSVVGVVPDTRPIALDLESGGEIYIPLTAMPHPIVTNILLRFQPGHDLNLSAVITAVTASATGLRVQSADTLASALGQSIDWRRFQAWLFVTLGTAALAIVGVGVLGLMAMRTGRRTREVGVRMALGATKQRVRRQLLSEQIAPVVVGLLVGSAGALWMNATLHSYLYKPPVHDWSAWTAAVLLITAAALVGTAIPAWKASAIDPARALRND